MTAAEILTNSKARTALKSLQMMNKLAAEASAMAMAERDGEGYYSINAEAQASHREQELFTACEVQAKVWGLNTMEVLAIAMGQHSIQQAN